MEKSSVHTTTPASLTNHLTDLNIIYNNIKKQSRQECRSAYNNYVQNLIDPNTKAISKRIKSKNHDHTGLAYLFMMEPHNIILILKIKQI